MGILENDVRFHRVGNGFFDLNGAILTRAKLNGAILTGAILLGAIITQAQLDTACGDENTLLPPGLTIKPCSPPIPEPSGAPIKE